MHLFDVQFQELKDTSIHQGKQFHEAIARRKVQLNIVDMAAEEILDVKTMPLWKRILEEEYILLWQLIKKI